MNKFKNPAVIGLLILAFSFNFLGACKIQPASKKQPNIIFYLADDQDKYDYGCYGNEKIKTPAVDRLAREGLVFENAFTGQAICAPSRSQLYTGNYPLKNGCFLNHVKTKSDQLSITAHLKKLGYEVILAGKSHVGPAKVYNWDKEWKPVKVEGMPRPYLPLDSIKAYFEKADKPFCMFITSEYPHPKYIEVENPKAEDVMFLPFEKGLENNPSAIKRKAEYYRSVYEDNNQLEKVLDWVDQYLGDNTLFIYSADHGASGKFTVYDRGLNVPFVVRWPGVIKANTRSNVMVHYTDVLPTYIDIIGGEAPEGIDGTSFLPVLKGSTDEIHGYVYGVRTNQNIQQASVFPSRMVRNQKYKYIKNFNSIEVVDENMGDNEYVNEFIRMGAEEFKDVPYEELYDIENDPFEQVNLAQNDEYKEIKETLSAELSRWMKEQGDILGEPGYMPLIKPSQHWLDRTSRFRKVAPELENTLDDSVYLDLHYLY